MLVGVPDIAAAVAWAAFLLMQRPRFAVVRLFQLALLALILLVLLVGVPISLSQRQSAKERWYREIDANQRRHTLEMQRAAPQR